MNHCSNPKCKYHKRSAAKAKGKWYTVHGTYTTAQHQRIVRYRCKECGKTFTKRTGTSLHYLHDDNIVPELLYKDKNIYNYSIRQLASLYNITESMARLRIKRMDPDSTSG